MRDPERVFTFANQFAYLWHKMPEQRFGQLTLNFYHWLEENKIDVFLLEDYQMIEKFKEYIAIFTAVA